VHAIILPHCLQSGTLNCPWELLILLELTTYLVFICYRFNENVVNKPGFVDVYPASRISRNMQHHFKSVYRFKPGNFEKQSSQMDTTKQKGLRIATDSGNVSTVLVSISDEEVSLFCFSCRKYRISIFPKFCVLKRFISKFQKNFGFPTSFFIF
jgi:hypothetical protein